MASKTWDELKSEDETGDGACFIGTLDEDTTCERCERTIKASEEFESTPNGAYCRECALNAANS